MINKTKIIATLGPASSSQAVIQKMIEAGMNVARLNFSHGNYETHTESIKLIRSLSRTMNRHVGILLDLQGPKIRTGKCMHQSYESFHDLPNTSRNETHATKLR